MSGFGEAQHDAFEVAQRVVSVLTAHFTKERNYSQWNREKRVDKFECVVQSRDACAVIRRAHELLGAEDNMLELTPPVMVCGDIHGQFYDLLKLFYLSGGWDLLSTSPPSNHTSSWHEDPLLLKERAFLPHMLTAQLPSLGSVQGSKYLFLGDYVDRGSFSCEVVLLLLALKAMYPKRLYLLRGNHECRSMTTHSYDDGFNFKEECEAKFGAEVYDTFMECFDVFPLCAMIRSPLGSWFCTHGGLGPLLTSADDVKSIVRSREPPLTGPMCDLLWADPLLEEVLGYHLSDSDYEEFLELDYLPNPPRGCSHLFGFQAIRDFVAASNINGIIRAHQCKEEGVTFHYAETRSQVFSFPLVTTVFSAPNYCGTHNNKAAILVFTGDEVKVLPKHDSAAISLL